MLYYIPEVSIKQHHKAGGFNRDLGSGAHAPKITTSAALALLMSCKGKSVPPLWASGGFLAIFDVPLPVDISL